MSTPRHTKPPTPDKRTEQVLVRFTTTELARVRQACGSLDWSAAQFLRHLALTHLGLK